MGHGRLGSLLVALPLFLFLLGCLSEAQQHNNRGLELHNAGKIDEAIAEYSEAIRLDPELVEPYNNRGAAYNDKGEYALAVKDLKRAIELDPSFAMAYNNLGNSYLGMGDYERAILEYTEAIERDENLLEAHANRGMLLAKLGRDAEARYDLEKCIDLAEGKDDEKALTFCRERLAELEGR